MKLAKRRTPPVNRVRLTLTVNYRCKPEGTPSTKQFIRWARQALQPGVHQAEIGLRLVDAKEGQALNQRYRSKDHATNVLTFALNEGENLPGLPLIGDIVLTVPVVVREAQEQDKALDAHYAHLVVHGMLHLQGFDHQQDAEACDMETLESAILQRLGYQNPYREELG